MSIKRMRRAFLAAAVGATAAVLAAGAPAARADEPPLIEENFNHLLKVLSEKGTPIVLPPEVTSVLRIGSGQKASAVQVAMQQDDGAKHGFARLDDGSGFFMFVRTQASAVTVFHVTPELKLVRAAGSFANNRMIPMPMPTAQKKLAEEFAAWSTVLSAKRESPWNDAPVTGVLPPVPKRKLNGVTDK